jgi:hypothetical protein
MAHRDSRPHARTVLLALMLAVALLWLAAPAWAADLPEAELIEAADVEASGGVPAPDEAAVPGPSPEQAPPQEPPAAPAGPAEGAPVAPAVEPQPAEAVPAPKAQEERPPVELPQAGGDDSPEAAVRQLAAQNLNLDIRVLSPGDNGPVNQDAFFGGPAAGDPSEGAPGGGLEGWSWNWNWNWSADCGGGANAAEAGAGWNWNWNWCGDIGLPDLLDPDPRGDSPAAGLEPTPGPQQGGDQTFALLQAPTANEGADHPDERPERQAAGAPGGPRRTAPVSAGGADGGPPVGPAATRALAADQSQASVPDRSRQRRPEPHQDPGAPLGGPAASSGGGSGGPLLAALLAVLLLAAPGVWRELARTRHARMTSIGSSRLERPG